MFQSSRIAAYRIAASVWDLPSATKTATVPQCRNRMYKSSVRTCGILAQNFYRKEFSDTYELKKIKTFLKYPVIAKHGAVTAYEQFCR